MAQENVEAIGCANVEALRPVYEQWGRGNWARRFDVYAPEMEWGWSEEFPAHGVSRDFIAAGEFVVVLTRYTGRGKESGAAVDADGAHLWTLRDGKAIRLEVFSSRGKALRAAGLAE